MKHAKNVSLGRVSISRVITTFVFVLVACLVSYALLSRYAHYRALKAKVASVEKELNLLRKENLKLKHEIDMLHSPGRIEGLAREQLGLTKPGELAFRVTGTSQRNNLKEGAREIEQDEGTFSTSKEQNDSSWWNGFWRRLYDTLHSIFSRL